MQKAERIRRAVLTAALVAGVLAALMGAGAVSCNRGFQVDEVEHIKVAYNVRQGLVPYSDFWEGHHLLLHALLIPVVDDDDPVASYRRARWVSLALMLATVAFAAFVSRRLAGNLAGVITGGALLMHSTFVERGMEVRPDIGLALGTVIALAIQLGDRPDLRKYCWQAVALSAAFLFSTKAVFVCFAFGCVWLVSAVRQRRPALVVIPFAVWCAPFVAMLVLFAALGNLDEYFQVNWGFAFGHVSGESGHSFSPWRYLDNELSRNRVFAAAGIAGLGFTLGAIRQTVSERWFACAVVLVLLLALRAEHFALTFFPLSLAVAVAYLTSGRVVASERDSLFVVGWVALVALMGVWLNPFPFPYLHVTALPTLAIVAGVVLARAWSWTKWSERPSVGLVYVAVVLSGIAWWSYPRILDKARVTNDYQFAVLEEVQRLTEPDDAAYDIVGMYFRPDAYPVFTMTGVMMKRHKREGVYPDIAPLLRENQAVVFIENYRTGWLPKRDKVFISQHFIRYAGPIRVLGTAVNGARTARFEVLKDKQFAFVGTGVLHVDGRPFTEGVLTRGVHTLSSPDGSARGQLVLASAAQPPPEILGEKRRLYEPANFD